MAAALVAVSSVAIWAFAHASVDAESLTRSVERESGSQGGIVSESPGCRTTAVDIWGRRKSQVVSSSVTDHGRSVSALDQREARLPVPARRQRVRHEQATIS